METVRRGGVWRGGYGKEDVERRVWRGGCGEEDGEGKKVV